MLELGDNVDVFQRGSSSSGATGCIVLCTMFCNNSTARECTCDRDCKCFVVSNWLEVDGSFIFDDSNEMACMGYRCNGVSIDSTSG